MDDVNKIIQTAYKVHVKYGLMLQTGYECALRVSVLCNLTLEDFNYKDCTITVRALKKGYVQSIPITSDLCLSLSEYIKKEKPKNTYLKQNTTINGMLSDLQKCLQR